MEEDTARRESSSDACEYSIGNTAQEKAASGYSSVPDRYVLPPSRRPCKSPDAAAIPVIDLSGLVDRRSCGLDRSRVVAQIGNACRNLGCFQVVNHGIDPAVMSEAIAAANEFFNLPTEGKRELMSNDVKKPVRYGTSLKDGVDRVQFWRVFLKHYAHPLEQWIGLWPKNPPTYRENMGKFSVEVRKVAMEILGAITESLGLGPSYLCHQFEDGMQVMAVNCYPPCPHPDLALGLPPHSDYSCITILLQSHPGLEVMDMEDGTWRVVQDQTHPRALQVHIGDHLEVLSNGLYKSVVHQATLNSNSTRISIASLHSLGMDVEIGVARELLDEEHPKGYKETSFRDFLEFLSTNDISEGRESYINSLKIKN